MAARIGRPKVENPKDIRFSIRLDAKEYLALQEYCDEKKVTKTEAIRQGLYLLLGKK